MRLFGHPVHPMLVAFPVSLLVLAPVWDGLAWLGIMSDAKVAGYFCLLGGLVMGGLAVVTGFADLLKIPSSNAAATKVALVHASCALTAVSLGGIALAFRGGRGALPGSGILALEAAGALALMATGWLGGHLVFAHGIGVRPRPDPRDHGDRDDRAIDRAEG
jgi:uncharacterized membrane protein